MVVQLFVFNLGSQASGHFALAIAPIRYGDQVTMQFHHCTLLQAVAFALRAVYSFSNSLTQNHTMGPFDNFKKAEALSLESLKQMRLRSKARQWSG